MVHGSENHLLRWIPNDRQPQQTETLQPGMALLCVAVITAGVVSAPSAQRNSPRWCRELPPAGASIGQLQRCNPGRAMHCRLGILPASNLGLQ